MTYFSILNLEIEEKYVNNTEWRGHEAGAPQPNIPQPEFAPSQF